MSHARTGAGRVSLLFDSRWRGPHGIGRYASEVLTRLAPRISHVALESGAVRHTDFVSLARALRASKADALYSPGFHAAWPSSATQFLTVHDTIHLDVPSERSTAKALYYGRVVRPAVRQAGLVFTVSEFSKARLVREFGIEPADVVVTSNGCSPTFLQPSGDAPDPARPYALCVANAKPYKNLDLMVNAARMLPANWRVICVGVPEAHGRSRLGDGLAERFAFRNGISDDALRSLYARASAVAIPSRAEGFGLPAVEALGQGAPVVYCAEAIEEVAQGLALRVTDAGDAESFAHALQHAAATDSQSQRAARRQHASLFSWERVADRVYEALRERLPRLGE